jgi:hypothetical protein
MRLRRNSDELERIRVRSVPRTTDGEFEHCSARIKVKRRPRYTKVTDDWSPSGFRPILYSSTSYFFQARTIKSLLRLLAS